MHGHPTSRGWTTNGYSQKWALRRPWRNSTENRKTFSKTTTGVCRSTKTRQNTSNTQIRPSFFPEPLRLWADQPWHGVPVVSRSGATAGHACWWATQGTHGASCILLISAAASPHDLFLKWASGSRRQAVSTSNLDKLPWMQHDGGTFWASTDRHCGSTSVPP